MATDVTLASLDTIGSICIKAVASSLDSIGSICIKAVASKIMHFGFSIHASLPSDMLLS